MNKVLVIGAGIGQVHLVNQAKSMGLYVSVVSPKGYPAIEFADELFECDIFDCDRIIDYARNHHFRAVLSDQNDLMMPTVANVAEHLGLPGNTLQQVLSYCNKNNFRKVCSSAHVPVPLHMEVENATNPLAFDVEFPWIIKPADSQSSMGVTKITAMSEYANAVDYALSYSRTHTAIVEQCVTGNEYVCEGFVYEGKYYHLSFGERRYFSGTLIPSQTFFPSRLDTQIQARILACEEALARAIHPSFGIIHSEYMVNEQTGEFWIIESAIRGGGVYTSSHLIPLATGVNIQALLIRCALGDVSFEFVEEQFSRRKHDSSAYLCFTLPEGIIKKVEGIDTIRQWKGVEMFDARGLEVGTTTERMINKGMRKGPILIYGKDLQELEALTDSIKRTLRIEVETPNREMGSIIWN